MPSLQTNSHHSSSSPAFSSSSSSSSSFFSSSSEASQTTQRQKMVHSSPGPYFTHVLRTGTQLVVADALFAKPQSPIVCLSLYLPVGFSTCLSVCLSVCLSTSFIGVYKRKRVRPLLIDRQTDRKTDRDRQIIGLCGWVSL